jgi:hypothetical protein
MVAIDVESHPVAKGDINSGATVGFLSNNVPSRKFSSELSVSSRIRTTDESLADIQILFTRPKEAGKSILVIETRGPIPAAVRQSVQLWLSCIAGALEVEEFRAMLAAAGFRQIAIEPMRLRHRRGADFAFRRRHRRRLAGTASGR